MRFGCYLKNLRKNLSYSQQQTVLILKSYSNLFFSLDNITLSRWENGNTTPSLRKQAYVIAALVGLYEARDYIKKHNNYVLSPLSFKHESEEAKLLQIYVDNREDFSVSLSNITCLKQIEELDSYLSIAYGEKYDDYEELISKSKCFLRKAKTDKSVTTVGHSFFSETTIGDLFSHLKNIESKGRSFLNNINNRDASVLYLISDHSINLEVEEEKTSFIINHICKLDACYFVVRPILTRTIDFYENANSTLLAKSTCTDTALSVKKESSTLWHCYIIHSVDLFLLFN
ncbi:hypothetical protein ACPV5O_25470 [Vibrio maritimus]|uniref:hypothetical protein n=1 Tax=Vibrio maritimus TaxID=990268 RepID=UPI004068F98B